MAYDTMKATITVEVAKNGHTLTTVTNVVSTGGVDANGNQLMEQRIKSSTTKITPPETPDSNQKNSSLTKKNLT